MCAVFRQPLLAAACTACTLHWYHPGSSTGCCCSLQQLHPTSHLAPWSALASSEPPTPPPPPPLRSFVSFEQPARVVLDTATATAPWQPLGPGPPQPISDIRGFRAAVAPQGGQGGLGGPQNRHAYEFVSTPNRTHVIQDCLSSRVGLPSEHGCGCDLGEDVPSGHHGGFRS
jgi:hypothetical protein